MRTRRRIGWATVLGGLGVACGTSYGVAAPSAMPPADGGTLEAGAATEAALADASGGEGVADGIAPLATNCQVLSEDAFSAPLSPKWTVVQRGPSSSVVEINADEGVLHVTSASSTSQTGIAYVTQSFANLPFTSATLDYDFAWHQVDGYAELGCDLTYASASDDTQVRMRLKRDEGSASLPPPAITGLLAYSSTSAQDPSPEFPFFGATAADTVHHFTSKLDVGAQSEVALAMSMDGVVASPRRTVLPAKELTVLVVYCGVQYLELSTSVPKEVDVRIDNVKLTICQ